MNILYPMYGMVVLTLLVAPSVFFTRRWAVRSGRMVREAFRFFDGTGAPDAVTKTTRQLANLFEMPVLFYVACLTAYLLHMQSALLVGLGWMYVLLRTGHTCIHLTYNKMQHRTLVYMLSNVPLYLMWIMILFQGVPAP